MANLIIGRASYVRKIGEGQYEYGWYQLPANFRKQATVYEPVGVADTVADAEAARAALPSNIIA